MLLSLVGLEFPSFSLFQVLVLMFRKYVNQKMLYSSYFYTNLLFLTSLILEILLFRIETLLFLFSSTFLSFQNLTFIIFQELLLFFL